MTKNDLQTHLQNADTNGTLMTPKHDPNNLSTTYSSFRTVLSYELANSLSGFISSGQFTATEYENTKYPHSPIYIEIAPQPGSTFSVPASGVAANSPMASTALDRIIAVSGTNQGWHIFGEDSQVVQRKLSQGDLKAKGNLI